MWLTADPVLDAERYAEEQERWLRSRPVCCKCKEHIQEPEAVKFKEKYYCEECEDSAWEEIRKEYTESIGD